MLQQAAPSIHSARTKLWAGDMAAPGMWGVVVGKSSGLSHGFTDAVLVSILCGGLMQAALVHSFLFDKLQCFAVSSKPYCDMLLHPCTKDTALYWLSWLVCNTDTWSVWHIVTTVVQLMLYVSDRM